MIVPTILAAALSGLPPDAAAHWYDGRAEVAGYELTQPRYGQLRKGRAVLVYVTETFSESARVKADPGRHPPSDEFGVVKLNFIKDFQTGIYDYNILTSVFMAVDPRYGRPAGTLTKLTFSAQEWCGHTFSELLFDQEGLDHRGFSYFDGEGNEMTRLDHPKDGLTVEQLFIRVRGLPDVLVEPGGEAVRPILGSVERMRLLHGDLRWVSATISRSAQNQSIRVPAGTFSTTVFEVRRDDERYRFFVEAAFPNRLVQWDGPSGEVGRLTGALRTRYWMENREGDESLLRKLGL